MANKTDRPWIMRTYAGHSTAEESNKLFKMNLSKGQTGLSVAFDLPTQTGYDSDHILSQGEVGKVGVPISNLDDMNKLFQDIPLDQMNTSMTINAPAAWLLSLYCATAEKSNVDISKLQGTTQNDILKEYLSRGTYIFPPKESIKLISANPYNSEFTVFVTVSIDNLNEFSKVKQSSVKILDKINFETMNEINTKKAIFTSWSSILTSALYKFLSIILIGFTSR